MRTIFCFILLFSSFANAQERPLETVLQKGHTKYVTAYAFSPNGRFLASGSLDNTVILWNIESGKQIRSFSGHTKRLRSVEFSPDGKQLLTASKDNTAKIFEVVSGELLLEIRLKENDLHGAFYSPEGSKVLLVDGRDGLFVYDALSGNKINDFKKNYAAFKERFLFSSDGNKILSKDGYKGLVLQEVVSGDTLVEMEFDKSFKSSISPDGKTIVVSSSKLFAQLFDAETGQLIAELRDENGERCDGCNMHHVLSKDGAYVLTASNRTQPTLWSNKGKKIRQLNIGEETKTPTSMAFNATNDLVVIGFSKEVFVFDLKSGKKKMYEKNDHIDYFDFQFSPDGNFLAMPDENSSIGIWNARTGRKTKRLEGYQNHESNNGLRFTYDNWTHAGILQFISMKKKAHLSPDGKSYFIGNIDSLVLQIDIASGKVVQRFDGHSQAVWAYDLSPDGKVLATAGGDRQIVLWDVASGQEIKRLKGHREVVFELDFSADGNELISSSWDGTIRIWKVEDGSYRYFDLGNNSAYTVGFSPNDLYFLSGDLEKNVRYYEVDAGSGFRDLIGHTNIISDFEFSPDATKIGTCSWDGKIKVWDMLTGMLLAKMDDHQGQVYCLDFHPSEEYLVSGGGDNQIILWDYQQNKQLGALKGHTDAVTSVEITADGNYLLSCSADGMIKLWDLKTKQEIYTRVQINRAEWIATSPGGYFDGSSKALALVNYVSGIESIKVSSLFDKYYSPGLIERIKEGESFDDRGEEINRTLKESPSLAFRLTQTSKRSIPVAADSNYVWKTNRLPLDIAIDSKGKSLEEVRIYNNGKLVVKEVLNEEMVFRGGAKDVRNFEIPLYDGDNEISAVVINEDRTESEPANIFVSFDGEAAKTDIYILAIGINNYKNSAYNLSYAVNDAKSFLKALSKKSDSLFSAIHEYHIADEKATKSNISAALKEIEAEIGPEDVFVFYYAGHGVMGEDPSTKNADFFIVTHDVTNLYGDYASLKEKAFSATELMDNSVNILAAKQLFVIDACHSGGALESFAQRGGAREKALAQLARSTGTFFLTASQDIQFANEAGSLKHGLFTYALLEVLSGKSGAAYDQKVTVNEVKSYVEDRVPELSEEYHGSAQYPASYSFGQDFPLVIIR